MAKLTKRMIDTILTTEFDQAAEEFKKARGGESWTRLYDAMKSLQLLAMYRGSEENVAELLSSVPVEQWTAFLATKWEQREAESREPKRKSS